MSAPAAITIEGLTKRFDGHRALDEVTFSVPEGSVFGFLGPNGAGKTTTLRILAGLARPTSGRATIFGRDVVSATNEVRAVVGYLPDVPGFYGWMNARQFLEFTGDLFGLEREVLHERVEALLDLADLRDVSTKIGGFSRGMKQRLGVAQALVNAPRLLMLDEPTSALDPIGRKDVLDMVASLRGRTTVLFSTHILSDVERVCDRMVILDRGRVVVEAPIHELKERHGGHRISVDVNGGGGRLLDLLRPQPWLVHAELASDDVVHAVVDDLDAAQRAVPRFVGELDLALRRMEVQEPSLEDVFVEIVKEGRA